MLQDEFEQKIGYPFEFRHLFNDLGKIAFFVKNHRFQLVFGNRVFYERFGFSEEAEIVGKEDFEIFPRSLALKFRQDDERVMKTGESMPEMVELFLTRHGLPEWYTTNKRPVLDCSGRPAGIMGIIRRFEQARALKSSHAGISEAVGMMLSDPGGVPPICELAQSLNMSVRNFDRRFKEDTGLTPKQFLGRARVQRACKLLQDTDANICDLAIELGYCDQSAFTAHFRGRMGMTPLVYRKQFGNNFVEGI